MRCCRSRRKRRKKQRRRWGPPALPRRRDDHAAIPRGPVREEACRPGGVVPSPSLPPGPMTVSLPYRTDSPHSVPPSSSAPPPHPSTTQARWRWQRVAHTPLFRTRHRDSVPFPSSRVGRQLLLPLYSSSLSRARARKIYPIVSRFSIIIHPAAVFARTRRL